MKQLFLFLFFEENIIYYLLFYSWSFEH